VNVFDEGASWTVFQCMGIRSFTPPDNTFSFGPFSNGADGTFYTNNLWVVKLGKVLSRHYTHKSGDYTFIPTSQKPDLPPIGGIAPPGKGKGPGKGGWGKAKGSRSAKGAAKAKKGEVPVNLEPAAGFPPGITLQQLIASLLPGIEAAVRENVAPSVADIPKNVATHLGPIIKSTLSKPGKKPDWAGIQARQITDSVKEATVEVVDEVKTLQSSVDDLRSDLARGQLPVVAKKSVEEGTVTGGHAEHNTDASVTVCMLCLCSKRKRHWH
jgi:hypothetical protein